MSRLSLGAGGYRSQFDVQRTEQWVDGTLLVTPTATFHRDEAGFVVRVPSKRSSPAKQETETPSTRTRVPALRLHEISRTGATVPLSSSKR